MRYVLLLVRMIWETHRPYTVAMAVLRVLRAFFPLATLWVGKMIIDIVLLLQSGSGSMSDLWKLVVLEIGIVVTGDALARASTLVESLLGDLFSNRTSIRLMEHAATLDLYQFEDPAFYDRLERARRQTNERLVLLSRLLSMAQDFLTLASLGAALLIYSPLLVLLLVLTVVPSFLGETHFAFLEYSLFYHWTPERRRLDYLRYMGASDETAKEVQVFGLAGWVIERFRNLSQRFFEQNKKLSVRKSIVSALLTLLSTLGYYLAFLIILLRAVAGAITIGSLTFLAGSIARSRDLIQRLLLGASDLYEQSLYLKDLFDFLEMKPTIVSLPNAPPAPDPIKEGFAFEDVGFQYPGSDRWAVRHVSFRVLPGQRIALVGENGAGKTTLTKLLARLYDPTEGRILLDGRDLREYNLESVRRVIGVIFQDFVKYDLRFDENISVGQIDRVRTYLDAVEESEARAAADGEGGGGGGNGAAGAFGQPATSAAAEQQVVQVPEAIMESANKSMADSFLSRLPDGYRQMLGFRFEGAVQLSGGEWQKVALARAYIRQAQVLILDEPTAALDARAEYQVFSRFSDLIGSKMAVIISHRFSTVRMADRIIVLNEGRVVEEGTHQELFARKGLYAELFSLQAEGYR